MYTPNLNAVIREVESLRCAAVSGNARQRSDEDAWKRVEDFRVRVLHLEKALEAKAQALSYNEATVAGLRAELKQKQESWDKAASYRDEVLKLREENAVLEKRITERYSDANYHMGHLDRLANFVKPKDLSSAGVVDAAINWINRLIEDHERSQKAFRELGEERDRLRDWKVESCVMSRKWDEIDKFVREHPDARIGDSISTLALRWLKERDAYKKLINNLRDIITLSKHAS
jgi:tetratricopeptide (TPR) repeat protein